MITLSFFVKIWFSWVHRWIFFIAKIKGSINKESQLPYEDDTPVLLFLFFSNHMVILSGSLCSSTRRTRIFSFFQIRSHPHLLKWL